MELAVEPLEPEKILSTRVRKKPNGKEHLEYLVKWKYYPVEDATQMTVSNIQEYWQHGRRPHEQEFMNVLFLRSLMQEHYASTSSLTIRTIRRC